MFLVTFVALLSFGFGTWILGHYFGYHGIASIGAVLIIAVGGAVALTDLRVKTGESVQNEYTVVDNETVVSNQSIQYEYTTVSVSSELGGTGPLSIGGLVMIIGGALMTQHLSEVTF